MSDVTLFDPELNEAFGRAARILNGIISSGDDADFDVFHARLDNVLFTSLAVLNSEELFKTYYDIHNYIVNIWIGDRSDEEAIDAANRLNPPQAVEMYREQIRIGREIDEKMFRMRRENRA